VVTATDTVVVGASVVVDSSSHPSVVGAVVVGSVVVGAAVVVPQVQPEVTLVSI